MLLHYVLCFYIQNNYSYAFLYLSWWEKNAVITFIRFRSFFLLTQFHISSLIHLKFAYSETSLISVTYLFYFFFKFWSTLDMKPFLLFIIVFWWFFWSQSLLYHYLCGFESIKLINTRCIYTNKDMPNLFDISVQKSTLKWRYI